jgi:hypothetical protein
MNGNFLTSWTAGYSFVYYLKYIIIEVNKQKKEARL